MTTKQPDWEAIERAYRAGLLTVHAALDWGLGIRRNVVDGEWVALVQGAAFC